MQGKEMYWLFLNFQHSLKWDVMKIHLNGYNILPSKLRNQAALLDAKAHLEQHGVKVLGVTNHGIFHSIYFFDPNGHRLELTYNDSHADAKIARITEEMKLEMLDEWSRTKRAPQHTHFLHEEELGA
jgi:catechol-2,3-dioxygenase